MVIDDELASEMEAIQAQIAKANRNGPAKALKAVTHICREFGFTVGMLKGSLAEGRKTK